MVIIDTHAHLDGPEFENDLDEVLQRASQAGVQRILVPAINWKDFPHLLSVCAQHPNQLHPMLGLHPEEVNPTTCDITTTLNQMEDWLRDNHTRIVAIGEIGLDLYWDDTYKEEQIRVFARQVQWALQYDLPLMIHVRKAQNELVSTLRNLPPNQQAALRGVFHCFTGSPEQARELLTFPKFCLGIGGALTFKKAKLPQTLAQHVPLNRLVIETDAPYLTPAPHRGQRNESAFTLHVAKKLAETYSLTVEEIAQATTQNAMALFFPNEK